MVTSLDAWMIMSPREGTIVPTFYPTAWRSGEWRMLCARVYTPDVSFLEPDFDHNSVGRERSPWSLPSTIWLSFLHDQVEGTELCTRFLSRPQTAYRIPSGTLS